MTDAEMRAWVLYRMAKVFASISDGASLVDLEEELMGEAFEEVANDDPS